MTTREATWTALQAAAKAYGGGSPSMDAAKVLSQAAYDWAAANGYSKGSAPASSGGLVFPPYGRSKGKPVSGASLQDLEFYANGCRRTLSDLSKERWHDKERVLLNAIEAEISRQGGGSQPSNDADAPF